VTFSAVAGANVAYRTYSFDTNNFGMVCETELSRKRTLMPSSKVEETADKNSAGEKGDALFKLAELYYQKQAFSLAKDFAIQAVSMRRMFYGKESNESREAVNLATLIMKEIERTQPPRRRRRKRTE